MKSDQLPQVQLRDLTIDGVEDRFKWSLDKEVTKHLNIPDRYSPFSKEETIKWIEMCINRTNGYEQKAIVTKDGKHIGWIDLKNIDTLNKTCRIRNSYR